MIPAGQAGLTRRHLLASAASAGLAACQTPPVDDASASLAQLAARCGLMFGACIRTRWRDRPGAALQDRDYAGLFRRECSALVCENEMKWIALRPDAGTFAFTPADSIAAFAAESGMKLRGHTLLWHHSKWLPDWLKAHDFGVRPASEAERLLVEHIRRVCARYPQVVSWDVVNETIHEETGELRDTVFSRYLGERVIDIAFHTAREAAPRAQLVYNDYMGWGSGGGKHRDGVLRLLEGMRARAVPVDALGLQSHIGWGEGYPPIGLDEANARVWRGFLDSTVGLKLHLLVTEMDVEDRFLPADIALRDAAVAGLTRDYLDLMLDYRQLTALMLWGLDDGHSWLQQRNPRADSLPKRPSPYDAQYRSKPMRTAIADAMRSAASRRAEHA